MFRKVKYITVIDNWHPNFNGNQVKITLGIFSYNNSYYVKLMAWGADDFGLEICIDDLTFQDAIGLYNNKINTLYYSILKINNKNCLFNYVFKIF